MKEKAIIYRINFSFSEDVLLQLTDLADIMKHACQVHWNGMHT